MPVRQAGLGKQEGSGRLSSSIGGIGRISQSGRICRIGLNEALDRIAFERALQGLQRSGQLMMQVRKPRCRRMRLLLCRAEVDYLRDFTRAGAGRRAGCAACARRARLPAALQRSKSWFRPRT